jgi:hypothetical protein
LLEPQPQRTNEMIARQKRLGTAFNGDIVRRELRPARRGKDWETPTQILDFSPLTAVQESPHETFTGNVRQRPVRFSSPHTRNGTIQDSHRRWEPIIHPFH